MRQISCCSIFLNTTCRNDENNIPLLNNKITHADVDVVPSPFACRAELDFWTRLRHEYC